MTSDVGVTPPSTSECLEDFIVIFGASLDPRLWLKLIKEETEELLDEKPGTEEHLKEAADLLYVLEGLDRVVLDFNILLMGDEEFGEADNIISEAESLVEAAETYYSFEVVHDAFLRVHESNMSKLDDNGRPILRDDGKVLKGPNYKVPDLSDLV